MKQRVSLLVKARGVQEYIYVTFGCLINASIKYSAGHVVAVCSSEQVGSGSKV